MNGEAIVWFSYCMFLALLSQANDKHLEAAGQTEIFRKHPRKASILNMPLVTTLFYSCFYHYTEAEVRMIMGMARGGGLQLEIGSEDPLYYLLKPG